MNYGLQLLDTSPCQVTRPWSLKGSIRNLKNERKKKDSLFMLPDLAGLKKCGVTRTASEQALPSPNFHTTPTGGRLSSAGLSIGYLSQAPRGPDNLDLPDFLIINFYPPVPSEACRSTPRTQNEINSALRLSLDILNVPRCDESVRNFSTNLLRRLFGEHKFAFISNQLQKAIEPATLNAILEDSKKLE
ncbi:hypothetical protein TNCV_3002031 [Trichonephila clavipes]|nr:hypothetical protein TNCV_3002031 [Trichonephila clavipes]